MTASLTTILIDAERWQIGVMRGGKPELIDVPLDDAATDRQRVAALKQTMRKHRIRGRTAVLAVPGRWCLSASINTDGLMRRGRRSGMNFRLEDKLPLDAEQVTADFIETGDTALGVAIETSRLQPVLQAMQKADMVIVCLCPLELLALQHVQEEVGGKFADAAVAIAHGDGVSVISTLARPRSWRFVPTGALSTHHLSAQRLDAKRADTQPLQLVTVNVDATRLVGIDQNQAVTIAARLDNLSPAHRAVMIARSIAIEGHSAVINLRRDRLAPPDRLHQIRAPLLAALWTLVLLLSAVAATFFWRADHQRNIAQTLHREQQAVYHEAFPGREVPMAVRATLASEVERLRGMSGTSDELPQRASPTSTAWE